MLSVIDYGLGLTTMTQTNLLNLDRVQNEAMRVILGNTKDTPVETIRFMLDLPPMQTRQKVEQVIAYFSAVGNSHKGCRLARGKSWMGHAQDSILQVCQRTELNKPRNGKGTQNRFRRLNETLLPENLLKALSRMASRQNRVRDQASHSRKHQTARPHSVH